LSQTFILDFYFW